MPLETSGTLSIGGSTTNRSINLEFGRTATQTTAMSQLYRNGGIVGAGAPNVPTSGTISISQFYGAANNFTFNQTLSSPTTNYNIYSAAVAAGWPTSIPLVATITINSGVVVSSTSSGTPAFQTGSPFPSGSTLALTNNGTIAGRGGTGGTGAEYPNPGLVGASGSTALTASAPISITNNATIGGGGGGGGGAGIFQETVNQPGETSSLSYHGGGGGGGGAGNGTGGQGGAGSGTPTGSTGEVGANGTATAGGIGGRTFQNPPWRGGTGGALGSSGSSGTNVSTGGGGGGATGAAVSGNSFITWVAFGTRSGPVT